MVKINWIEFENSETGLKCERVKFNDDITLLVGLSGAGKSQILDAIIFSLGIALNRVNLYKEFSAKLNFTINEGKEYEWSYVIKKSNDEFISVDEEIDDEEYEFYFEQLLLNNKPIFLREGEKISLLGFEKFPTPKKYESLLSQYNGEDKYKEIISDFKKICPLNMEIAVKGAMEKDSFLRFKKKINEIISRSNDEDFSSFNNLPTICKLYIAKKYFYDTKYVSIYNYVKELFPEISDINVEEDIFQEVYVTSIDVYNKKLLQSDISNGMLKTIYYIIELVASKPNSVILIDEFENGLGVNCIDALSELLLTERSDLQFIITSHHPKIIRQIVPCKWRIIERETSTISNRLAPDAGIDNNPHDAYFKLLNWWEFEGKI